MVYKVRVTEKDVGERMNSYMQERTDSSETIIKSSNFFCFNEPIRAYKTLKIL